ncbi:MAG: metal ABC transporter ATP-binding protein [Trueperaceae bacterium]
MRRDPVRSIGATPSPALEVRGLRVRYDDAVVLDGVDLQVPGAVMGAIVGPNGAGKSTLIKAVLGLVPVQAGEVRLLGEPAARGRRRVGYVPQRSTVDWDFPADALDVVTMGLYGRVGWFRRVGKAERAAALAALHEVGMADFAHRHIGQLSGGQQQRVFLARALVQDADLYLLDEPLAGVDMISEAALVTTLRRLRDRGKTVVAVHHDLNTLPRYFEWMALVNGRVHAQGAVRDVFRPDALAAAYGGRVPVASTGNAGGASTGATNGRTDDAGEGAGDGQARFAANAAGAAS